MDGTGFNLVQNEIAPQLLWDKPYDLLGAYAFLTKICRSSLMSMSGLVKAKLP